MNTAKTTTFRVNCNIARSIIARCEMYAERAKGADRTKYMNELAATHEHCPNDINKALSLAFGSKVFQDCIGRTIAIEAGNIIKVVLN